MQLPQRILAIKPRQLAGDWHLYWGNYFGGIRQRRPPNGQSCAGACFWHGGRQLGVYDRNALVRTCLGQGGRATMLFASAPMWLDRLPKSVATVRKSVAQPQKSVADQQKSVAQPQKSVARTPKSVHPF